MNRQQEHYNEAVRLLALVPIDPTRIPGLPDSTVIAQLAAARPDGLSLPGLARRLRQPLADTEQQLDELLKAGYVARLDTGLYGVPATTTHQPTGSTSSPETSTSTTNVLLAALSQALLALHGRHPHRRHRPARLPPSREGLTDVQHVPEHPTRGGELRWR